VGVCTCSRFEAILLKRSDSDRVRVGGIVELQVCVLILIIIHTFGAVPWRGEAEAADEAREPPKICRHG